MGRAAGKKFGGRGAAGKAGKKFGGRGAAGKNLDIFPNSNFSTPMDSVMADVMAVFFVRERTNAT